MLDSVTTAGGVIPIAQLGLGCVDAAPFFPGEPPVTCGSSGGGGEGGGAGDGAGGGAGDGGTGNENAGGVSGAAGGEGGAGGVH
jgi:hypothetical protein